MHYRNSQADYKMMTVSNISEHCGQTEFKSNTKQFQLHKDQVEFEIGVTNRYTSYLSIKPQPSSPLPIEMK